MPNGKRADNPLSDMTMHGAHPFPHDMEHLLRQIESIGRSLGRWPLGENWPYYPKELEWQRGENLDEGRKLLANLLAMLQAGRGNEILKNPFTGRPFKAAKTTHDR